MRTTIELTPNDIENIIKDYFKKSTVTADIGNINIEFVTEEKSVGYGPGEHQEVIFGGARATIEEGGE